MTPVLASRLILVPISSPDRSAPRRADRSAGVAWGRLAHIAIAVGALALSFAGPAGAADPERPRIESIDVGFGNRYTIGTWTPVRVGLQGGTAAFEGRLEVASSDDDGNPVSSGQSVALPAGVPSRVVGYARSGLNVSNFRARLFDREGSLVAEASSENLRGGDTPRALMPSDISLLALGRPAGLAEIAKQAGMSVTARGMPREVVVSRITGPEADDLPSRPRGYDGFEAVILDTNDKAMLASLATRGQALFEWVARGGHLVVSVGSNWQAVRESELAGILPVRIAAPMRVTDLRALESYAQAKTQITPDNTPAQVVVLEGAESSGAKVLSTTASTPLVVRGAYGFGRVTVLSFDVDSPPFSGWPDTGVFWIKAIDLDPGSAGTNAGRTGGRLVETGVSGLSALLRTALDRFEGVRLVPFSWVAGLIFLYILVIGPIDYLFLKKVVKRMELTWVTFPLTVIAVSVGAAYAAYRIKGTDLRVNQIEIVDVDQTTGRTRGTTYFNLFSPANRDYAIGFEPTGFAAVTGGTGESILTWLGVAESGLRGMNGNTKGLSFGNPGYSYAPDGRAERIDGMRIPIWSTKALVGTWYGKSAGEVVETELEQVGPDRLLGTITNRLDVALRGAVVAFGSQVYYNIPDIAPGATIRIELAVNRRLSGYLSELRKGYERAGAVAEAGIDRDALVRAIMFSKSENVSLDPLPNASLEASDLSDLLELDRPMLIARIDKAATKLDLGADSSEPKVGRTTMIRVILPLERSARP
ncbi:MAG: hypothetical protein SFX72_10025 [Isosphaeraceae bacterium]|nr:hypothetical protein [Isosphaeraceae bacterium]